MVHRESVYTKHRKQTRKWHKIQNALTKFRDTQHDSTACCPSETAQVWGWTNVSGNGNLAINLSRPNYPYVWGFLLIGPVFNWKFSSRFSFFKASKQCLRILFSIINNQHNILKATHKLPSTWTFILKVCYNVILRLKLRVLLIKVKKYMVEQNFQQIKFVKT